jgi:hypothetical protein
VRHLAYKKGFCLKSLTKEGCARGTACKFGHPPNAEIQQLKREAAAFKKDEAAVALVAEKKDTAAPAMTASTELMALMTEILNEAAITDGAGMIPKARGGPFGINCLVMEEIRSDSVVLEPNEILPKGGLDGADPTESGQEGILGREGGFQPMMAEEASEQEEPGEWLSQMEISEFPEVSVPIKKPKSSIPKRVRLMTPVRLVDTGKKADAAGNRKKTNQAERNYVRSGAMVIDFEIVSEEHADGAEGSGPRRAQFHASRRRRFGHRGRRLRFSRPDVHGYITVMKGAKRDVGREIKVPMYNATYSDTEISYQTTARAADQRRNDVPDVVQYDHDLRLKLDRRAAQRAVEAQNRKVKMERKRKAGAKRAKEAFERLWQQGTSAQAMRVLDDQRAERETRRRKQIKSGRKFVVALGDSMSGAALNAGFQFARSKIPNDKSWRNAYDQVQADWATRKQLTRKWTRILERRMRHRKVQAGKEGCKGKRVFMCSKRAMAVDGVCGKGAASFWKPVIVCCLLAWGGFLRPAGAFLSVGMGTGRMSRSPFWLRLERAALSSASFAMPLIRRRMLSSRDLPGFGNCSVSQASTCSSLWGRRQQTAVDRNVRRGLGVSVCCASHGSTFGPRRKSSWPVNGLVKDGSCSSFSQQRSRHIQPVRRCKWWRLRRVSL